MRGLGVLDYGTAFAVQFIFLLFAIFADFANPYRSIPHYNSNILHVLEVARCTIVVLCASVGFLI